MRPRAALSAAVTAVLVAGFTLIAGERPAKAQAVDWSIVYTPALPLGGIRNLTPKVTPFGFNADIRYWFPGDVSLGLSGGWTLFYHKSPTATYNLDPGAITATLYRYSQILSLAPEVHWYWDLSPSVVPFFGLEAGIAFVSFRVVASDLEVKSNQQAFILTPQLGILFPFDRNGIVREAIVTGVRYSFLTTGFRDASTSSFLGLAVGLLAL